MIREALDYLFTAGRTAAPSIVRAEAEPPHVYFVRSPDGNLTRREAARPPADHKPLSLEPLAELATEHAGPAEVWYGPTAVVAVLSEDRRERATLDLTPSEPFKLLTHWRDNKPSLPQGELIRALKVTLADCTGPAGNLVDILRKVKFRVGSETVAEIGHGRASIGKQLEGEVTGLGILPETVAFAVPVWATPCVAGIRGVVTCALDPDPASGTFRVTPLPGQLERVIEEAVQEVGRNLLDLLGGAAVSVYHGRP